MFLDSDEEFVHDVCERLYSKFKKSNADIITGNSKCVSKNIEINDLNYRGNYYDIIPNII